MSRRPATARSIGLTGPIGCGKSTVAELPAAPRREVVDADADRWLAAVIGAGRARAGRDRRTVRGGGAGRRMARSTGPPWAGASSPIPRSPRARGDHHPAVRPRVLATPRPRRAGVPRRSSSKPSGSWRAATRLCRRGLAGRVRSRSSNGRAWRARPGPGRGRVADRAPGRPGRAGRPVATRILDTSGSRAETEALVDAALAAALAGAPGQRPAPTTTGWARRLGDGLRARRRCRRSAAARERDRLRDWQAVAQDDHRGWSHRTRRVDQPGVVRRAQGEAERRAPLAWRWLISSPTAAVTLST